VFAEHHRYAPLPAQARFQSFVLQTLDQLRELWDSGRLSMHDLHYVLYPVEDAPPVINDFSPVQVIVVMQNPEA
jgi:hypothetical protein